MYEGVRGGDSVQVLINGEPLLPERSSVPVFGWGHPGCATVALAQALLVWEFGAASTQLSAEAFARDVLAEIPASTAWVMESWELRRWAGLFAAQGSPRREAALLRA